MTEVEKERFRQWLRGWKVVNEIKEWFRREEMYKAIERGREPVELTGHEWIGPLPVESLKRWLPDNRGMS
jgi:hypothetical protein